jgi:hypothetical protein
VGGEDPVIPLSVGEATQKCIKVSALEVLDKGHTVFALMPEVFLKILEPFFECFRTWCF